MYSLARTVNPRVKPSRLTKSIAVLTGLVMIWFGVVAAAAPPAHAVGDTNTDPLESANSLATTDFDTVPTGVAIQAPSRVGSPITATLQGAWSPTPDKITYTWFPAGSDLPGGPAPVIGKTYTPIASDMNNSIRLEVTAVRSGRNPSMVWATAIIAEGFLTSHTPTITGSATVGSKLTAVPGVWEPAPVTLTYQWLRDGLPVTNANSAVYRLVDADRDTQLSVRVTGSKAGFESISKTSVQTAKVVKRSPYVPPVNSPFIDVATNYKFYTPIAWMYDMNISTGVKVGSGREYQPKKGVSREAMAAFLYRLEGSTYKGPKVSPFTDVKPGDKFYNEIAWMREAGLSTGVKVSGGRAYQPKATVSREAMAAFIYRLEHATAQAPSTSPFGDMKPGDKFFKEIAWMSSSGLSTGIKQPSGERYYLPKAQVSREAMAAFLYRLENR